MMRLTGVKIVAVLEDRGGGILVGGGWVVVGGDWVVGEGVGVLIAADGIQPSTSNTIKVKKRERERTRLYILRLLV
jgi:hypothetical protein